MGKNKKPKQTNHKIQSKHKKTLFFFFFFFHEGVETLDQVPHGVCGLSVSGDIQSPTGQGPQLPALGNPALSTEGEARKSPEVPSSINHYVIL